MITPSQRNALPVFSTLDWDYFNVHRSVAGDEHIWFYHREWDHDYKPARRKFRHCEEDTWATLLAVTL